MRFLPITIFKCALNAPEQFFATIRGISSVDGGQIEVARTSLFAEATVLLSDGSRAMIFMPIRNYKREHVKQFAGLQSQMLSDYILLEDELSVTDYQGNKIYSDIIIQPIPNGELLRYTTLPEEQIMQMLDSLHDEFVRLNFSHNNLSLNNIIVGVDNRLHPIRYHYATLDGCFDDFSELKSRISTTSSTLCDVNTAYMEDALLNGPVCFTCDDKYGYLNERGEVVIPPKFIYGENFCENRAVVATKKGYGVIDETGKLIIPPVFDYIYYDRRHTQFQVFVGKLSGWMDYNGSIVLPTE